MPSAAAAPCSRAAAARVLGRSAGAGRRVRAGPGHRREPGPVLLEVDRAAACRPPQRGDGAGRLAVRRPRRPMHRRHSLGLRLQERASRPGRAGRELTDGAAPLGAGATAAARGASTTALAEVTARADEVAERGRGAGLQVAFVPRRPASAIATWAMASAPGSRPAPSARRRQSSSTTVGGPAGRLGAPLVHGAHDRLTHPLAVLAGRPDRTVPRKASSSGVVATGPCLGLRRAGGPPRRGLPTSRWASAATSRSRTSADGCSAAPRPARRARPRADRTRPARHRGREQRDDHVRHRRAGVAQCGDGVAGSAP